jgi:hypothetical protein
VDYSVILKDDGIEIDIGSIGIQHGRRHRALGLRYRQRDPNARGRRAGQRQGPQGLHASV